MIVPPRSDTTDNLINPVTWREYRWETVPIHDYLCLSIIGGNAAQIGNNLDGIVYEPGPLTLSRAYDPNVDTVYPEGLGRGILYVNGIAQPGYVLIRHNCHAYQRTVTTDHGAVRAVGTASIPYPASGTDPAGAVTAYLFDGV